MRIEINSKEVLLLLAASVMSLVANLPEEIVGNVVDKKLLLFGLTALIVAAMFRYLQMFLLLMISILAIGANLPEDLAEALGISQTALLASLGILIAVALLNRALGLLPAVSEAPAEEYTDRREDMLYAISKGDQVALHRMLVMNVSPNFSVDGITPLHLAAEKGYPEIVRMLIRYGADYRRKNADGMTALEIALSKKKFVQTTEILHTADKTNYSAYDKAEARRSDSGIWQNQYGYIDGRSHSITQVDFPTHTS